MYHSLYICDGVNGSVTNHWTDLLQNSVNTWDDWHIIPEKRPVVSPPEIKTQIIDLPGGHGFVDLSEIITNDVRYGQRQGSWTFIAHPDYSDIEPWNWKYEAIAQKIHGRNLKIILEDDPFYFYEGRLKVNQWDPGENWSKVTIDYTLQPFKQEIIISDAPWLWDPFSFVDGIIRSYSGLTVTAGTPKTVEVRSGAKKVIPTFVLGSAQDSLTVCVSHDGGTTWSTPETMTYPNCRFRSIKLSYTSILKFTGTGSVTIQFRGEWL